jgi:hypothetical protein
MRAAAVNGATRPEDVTMNAQADARLDSRATPTGLCGSRTSTSASLKFLDSRSSRLTHLHHWAARRNAETKPSIGDNDVPSRSPPLRCTLRRRTVGSVRAGTWAPTIQTPRKFKPRTQPRMMNDEDRSRAVFSCFTKSGSRRVYLIVTSSDLANRQCTPQRCGSALLSLRNIAISFIRTVRLSA